MLQPTMTLAWCGVLGALAVLSCPTAAGAITEPWRPTDAAQVLLRLPAGSSPRHPKLAELTAAVQARPDDLGAALALATYYTDLARSSQDTRFVAYAQSALAHWWDLAEPPLPVRLLRADVLQHRHLFAEAMAEIDAVLGRDQRNPRAWLGRAQLLLVTGRPQAAEASCMRLLRLGQPFAGRVCLGMARGLTGQAAAGRALIAATLEREVGAAPELRAWALGALGDIELGSANVDAARGHFRAALALDPQNAWTVNALADLLIASGDPAAALDLVGEDLQNDGKLLRAALATRMLGRPDERLVATLEGRFAAWRVRGDGIAQREEARFRLELMGDASQALTLATQNFAVQREVEDARLLLAAALAAGTPAAAAPALAWMAETGIEDARLEPLRARLVGRP